MQLHIRRTRARAPHAAWMTVCHNAQLHATMDGLLSEIEAIMSGEPDAISKMKSRPSKRLKELVKYCEVGLSQYQAATEASSVEGMAGQFIAQAASQVEADVFAKMISQLDNGDIPDDLSIVVDGQKIAGAQFKTLMRDGQRPKPADVPSGEDEDTATCESTTHQPNNRLGRSCHQRIWLL